MRPQSPAGDQQPPCALQERLVGLAGTPDDNSRITAQLITIAQLAADRIGAVGYASVTARHEGAYATVAASSELAIAVDKAQYADDAGPCLDALDGNYPAAVPDIAATMTWPGFRDIAFSLGLRASLSIPLFAGRGSPVAALNLYGYDPATMAPLTAAVWSAYDPEEVSTHPPDDLDDGGRELVGGLAGAFAVRTLIQRAIGLVMAEFGTTPDAAYLYLRVRAAEAGVDLAGTAMRLIADRRV
jgi:ANTAR domain